MLIRKFTDKQIIDKVTRLGNAQMRVGSHGFHDYKGMKIIDAATRQLQKTGDDKNAAIAIIGVVLGANRNWEKVVQPNLERLRKTYPELTFLKLRDMLSTMDWRTFSAIWGHSDKKKYDTLTKLVAQILKYSKENSTLNDLQLMNKWVKAFDLKMLNPKDKDYRNFPASIRNIGIATFQHIRMTFGVDTVKPDQRVKEVLLNEFGESLSDRKAILAVEEIANITKLKVITIDQIFVKYGSGYYVKNSADKEHCRV